MRIASLARTLVINIIKSAPLHICQTWKPKGQCLTQTKQDLVKQPENTYIFCFVLFCFVALTKHTRGVSSIYKKKIKKDMFQIFGASLLRCINVQSQVTLLLYQTLASMPQGCHTLLGRPVFICLTKDLQKRRR